jgi:hypothetical protein
MRLLTWQMPCVETLSPTGMRSVRPRFAHTASVTASAPKPAPRRAVPCAPHPPGSCHRIDYEVPVEKFDDIGRFDGSCLLDRTAGEAAARCDSEAANMITLNLMHDIVTGVKTVDEARKVYAENMAAYAVGRPAPLAEQLRFPLSDCGTEDADEAMMAGAMAHQLMGKAKDVLTDRESPSQDGRR